MKGRERKKRGVCLPHNVAAVPNFWCFGYLTSLKMFWVIFHVAQLNERRKLVSVRKSWLIHKIYSCFELASPRQYATAEAIIWNITDVDWIWTPIQAIRQCVALHVLSVSLHRWLIGLDETLLRLHWVIVRAIQYRSNRIVSQSPSYWFIEFFCWKLDHAVCVCAVKIIIEHDF